MNPDQAAPLKGHLFCDIGCLKSKQTGVQWLSGRVIDSIPRSLMFEPHQHHCVVSLSKNINPSLVLAQPRKTHPFITERLSMGRKESYQTKKTVKRVNNKSHERW